MSKNAIGQEPEEDVENIGRDFVDDYFAHEEYYENEVVDMSYIHDEVLEEPTDLLFGDEDFF